MAYPLTWDRYYKPTNESWWIDNASISGGRGRTGVEQVIGTPAGMWRAQLQFRLFRGEQLWLRALLGALNGRFGTVRVGPFDLSGVPEPGTGDAWAFDLGLAGNAPPFPRTDLSAGVDARLAAGAAMNAVSVQIAMGGGRAPNLGNYIGIGPNMHVITNVAPIGGGIFACGVAPWLRADFAADTAIDFTTPACAMRLAEIPSGGMPVDADGVTTVTLDFVEAF